HHRHLPPFPTRRSSDLLFGGTFDPIHSGHLRAAQAAASKFGLAQVLFVPSAYPPHKRGDRLTPFPHRFAMVALACARDPRFIPSDRKSTRLNSSHVSIS